MALYTSYYTRQLALRGDGGAGLEMQQEGEKTVQKSVPRRTVDFTGLYVTWFERRYLIRCPADVPALPPVAAGALQLLPPAAYAHQPASSFAMKFAGQAPSKTRSSINVATWTPDGRRCLTGTQAGEFTMWSGTTFQFETIIQSHETPVRTMTFTHNGNFLVSGDDSGTVRYWKTNLELVKSVAAHREAVRMLAFAPSDLKYATGSDDSTIRVWDFARVQTEQVLAGHGGDVKSVDWHPSKGLLVSGSKDGLVKLWCPRSGRNLSTLHGHKGTIMQTQWNQNGNWVLTASRDQTCKLYDVRMQRELISFRGHNRDVTYAAWHPLHEELFVSGGHDGSMIFWLASRQAPQAEVRGAHEASVWAAAWHPAGHLLATGAADYAVKFWCRCRPGDPFFEQQQEEQRELAALAAEEEPVAAPRPAALAAPAATFGPAGAAAGGAIPGIGDAVAMPTLPQATAVVDVFSIQQQPYDARGGRAPAAGASPAAAGQRALEEEHRRRRERSRR
ncbi:flowering time control FY-like isoform X1 [Chlorella sorokiniana]|uniref:Flowering time control FY-like isoform X1 n=1 Tax=Chlorella sorokiniana TaxID=3076 RepID=A0A2P6TQ75_CHLSO|nr:flowering time control FY-like isoform X1 [Chlorella sorokiniana]|eukprot:PRW56172.1 flowering time control FY-like isoform X1 [Chlorella sorokiniana]